MSPATRSRAPARRTRSRAPAPRSGWQRHKPARSARPSTLARAKSLHKRAKAARRAWRRHPVARARARYRRVPHRRRGVLFACVGAALAIGALTMLAVEGTALTIAAEANWVGAGLSMGLSAWEMRQDRKQRAANPAPPKPSRSRAPKAKPAPGTPPRAPHCPCQCRVHGQPANGKSCNCICAASAAAKAKVAKMSSAQVASAVRRHKAAPPPAKVP